MDSLLLGVLNIAGKRLGKLYPTNVKRFLAVFVVIGLYQKILSREHKKTPQGKQFWIKQVAFTERNRMGCLLFSPTFTCGLVIRFFISKYLSNNY